MGTEIEEIGAEIGMEETEMKKMLGGIIAEEAEIEMMKMIEGIMAEEEEIEMMKMIEGITAEGEEINMIGTETEIEIDMRGTGEMSTKRMGMEGRMEMKMVIGRVHGMVLVNLNYMQFIKGESPE